MAADVGVRQLPGRPGWYCDYRDARGNRRRCKGGSSKRTAERRLHELLADVEAERRDPMRRLQPTGKRLLDEFIEEYIERVAQHQASARDKVRRLRWWMKQLEPGLRLCDVTPRVVQAVLARRQDVSPASRNRDLSALKVALGEAVKWQGLPWNPITSVKQEAECGRRERVLSPEESELLLAACAQSRQPCLLPLVGLGLETGARRDELLKLRWVDVDFRRRRLTLRAERATRTKEALARWS